MEHTIIAIVCLFLFCCLAYRFRFWHIQGRKMLKPGYLPHDPSWFGNIAYRVLGRAFARIAVGPIKVIGKENTHIHGRLAVLPNHQHGLDFAVVRAALPFAYRQIGASKEVRYFPGMPAMAAWVGTFIVPVVGGKATDKEGGREAIKACSRFWVEHDEGKLVIFPQGKLVFDNVLRAEEFRTGVVRAMQAVLGVIEGDQPFGAIPIAVEYKRSADQASFGRRAVHRIWQKCFKQYKSAPVYGATVVIGKRFDVRTLPDDLHQATDVIRLHIQDLLERAQNQS